MKQQWGSEMGTIPSFLKGADLVAAPQQQIHSPGQQQTPATVPALTLPPMAKFAKFAQTAPAPALEFSSPFHAQVGQTADAVIPKMPNTLLLQVSLRQKVCSVPLLRVQPDPSKNFTIRQVPVPPIDSAMVVKPLAPSCDEMTSVQKPGITMPLPPNHR